MNQQDDILIYPRKTISTDFKEILKKTNYDIYFDVESFLSFDEKQNLFLEKENIETPILGILGYIYNEMFYDITINNYSIEDGYQQALKIIEKNDLPTAIFVAGDWMALGVIQALKEHDINVPEDISIIGYDDLEFLKYSQPALTTVSQNKLEIGKRAAQYLIQQINGETVSSLDVDVEIIERETCLKRL